MFKKAQAKQAKLKLGLYGKQGSGKTFTSLLIAEGLAAIEGKRIAYIDTERGTDFYCQSIPERRIHPEAFDFDALYTRSLMEAVEAAASLNPTTHGVVVVDSITHLWEAAREAYCGKTTSGGGIPIHAWAQIKKPYKRLMTELLNGDYHVIICGREGVVMENNEDGEMEVVGKKMKAEGETPYDPHILGRMASRLEPDGSHTVTAFFEKDRTGILQNRTIENPSFDTIRPILQYLGCNSQGKLHTPEEAAALDNEKREREEEREREERAALYETIRVAITTATDAAKLRAAWDMTKGKKTRLGDDYMGKLEAMKDARKGELMQGVA